MPVLIVFAVIIYIIVSTSSSKKRADLAVLNNLKPLIEQFEKANSDFEKRLLPSAEYFTNRNFESWKIVNQSLAQALEPLSTNALDQRDAFAEELIKFKNYYNTGRQYIDSHNKEFSKLEAEAVKPLLEQRQLPFNVEQLQAITSEEDNTLVVAGAGTGKTTTILGKLSYLIDRRHVPVGDILVLTFARKAVDEINHRINNSFGDTAIQAHTFHEFGLSVIGNSVGKKPSVAFGGVEDNKKTFINNTFESLLFDRKYAGQVVEYFLSYLAVNELQPCFETLDEYWQFIKEHGAITFQREHVKSQQEAKIANFLFMHQIEYVYEKPYRIDTRDKEHRQYCPDFYLPEYDIHIEHFGVDREGQVHFTNDEGKNQQESLRYKREMEWKRQIHQTNNTKLIETFSYEFNEQDWKQALTTKLQKHNVAMKERDVSDIIETLRKSNQIRRMSELLITFLDLAKSNAFTLEDMERKAVSSRDSIFLKIFSPIYEKYHHELARTDSIDFNDMPLQAADCIRTNIYQNAFKYIVIDEFQDFSKSRHRLIDALVKQNGVTKLFCVGDDWQSIYRFSGSDIYLMTHFEEFNGFTNRVALTRTNRFSNDTAQISNAFILMNPNQITKEVVGSSTSTGSALKILSASNESEKTAHLVTILNQINDENASADKPLSVFLLGRNWFNEPKNLKQLRMQFPDLQIEYLTVHGSKGKEADYVVILDVASGEYGFPNQIVEDPVLGLVLSESESYPHAEERRLMYVALTRARQGSFIISDSRHKSLFITELEKITEPVLGGPVCVECGGGMVERNGKFGEFYGCKNYPVCTYTKNIQFEPC